MPPSYHIRNHLSSAVEWAMTHAETLLVGAIALAVIWLILSFPPRCRQTIYETIIAPRYPVQQV